jgi:hypothetical protein
MTPQELRQEAAEQERLDRAMGSRAAIKWMKAHIEDFVPNQHNSDLIKEYLTENNLGFSPENLDEALAYLKAQGTLSMEPAPVVEEKKPDLPPYGALTRQSVLVEMDAQTIKKWRNDPQWGAQFRKDCEALGITEAKLPGTKG